MTSVHAFILRTCFESDHYMGRAVTTSSSKLSRNFVSSAVSGNFPLVVLLVVAFSLFKTRMDGHCYESKRRRAFTGKHAIDG